MSPALDMPLNRREAMTTLLAMLAFVMGTAPADAFEEREIALESTKPNGIPEVSGALFAAHLAITGARTDQDWRQRLHDAAELSDRMSMDEVKDACMDIWDRAKPLKCSLCMGLGFDVIVTGNYPNQHREYVDCEACDGTGRKLGS